MKDHLQWKKTQNLPVAEKGWMEKMAQRQTELWIKPGRDLSQQARSQEHLYWIRTAFLMKLEQRVSQPLWG